MGIIKVLDDKLINKIAAGEVIVGGASVLKELLENSIDAKSKNIIIDISRGGKDYIRIKDDGCGILPEDIHLAFLRNSTSKITDNIDKITTLGFRGEALASISFVSKIELITKTKDNATAKKCTIYSSEILSTTDISHTDGTEITIYDLFYNLPVRAKHLRDEQSETLEMIAVAENIALSHPEISFMLICDKKQLFSTPGNGRIYDTVYSVFGKKTAERFMPFNYKNDPLLIEGMLSSPNHTNERSQIRTAFVNGRYVKMPGLNKSIDTVYDELFARKRAEFILYITLPEHMIDVNVHPSKLSIKFYNESLISLLLRQGIRDFLKNNYILKEEKPKVEINEIVYTSDNTSEYIDRVAEESTKYIDPKTEQLTLQRNPIGATGNESCTMSQTISSTFKSFEKDNIHPAENKNLISKDIFTELSEAKFMGNAFGVYALIEYKDDLYAIDTHAAHERVLYENYLSSFNESKLIKQDMMIPAVVSLTPKLYNAALNNIDVFDSIGFEIADFADNSIIIRSIPHYFSSDDIISIFNKLMEKIVDNTSVESVKTRNEALIKIACHNAVRGNEDISLPETKALLKDLYLCDFPYACPHGRPTIGKINKRFFMKVFERIR